MNTLPTELIDKVFKWKGSFYKISTDSTDEKYPLFIVECEKRDFNKTTYVCNVDKITKQYIHCYATVMGKLVNLSLPITDLIKSIVP